VKKAKRVYGTRFIHVNIPCAPGWGFPTDDLVKLAKLAVDTAMWVLYEVEEGIFRLTGRSRRMAQNDKKRSIDRYLKLQERFKHVTPEQVERLQAWVDRRWEQFVQRHTLSDEPKRKAQSS
jgi:pyruvate ferredoxin oxidoreductase beta subunit